MNRYGDTQPIRALEQPTVVDQRATHPSGDVPPPIAAACRHRATIVVLVLALVVSLLWERLAPAFDTVMTYLFVGAWICAVYGYAAVNAVLPG